MIDKTHILVQAGDGGDGCESYYHRLDRKIVPNGGDGGRGGSIIFRATREAPPISRLQFRRHIVGESGSNGGANKKRGKNGSDMIVLVPNGTSLYDRNRNLALRESMVENEEVVVAMGGKGGTGNHGGKTAVLGERGVVLDLEISAYLAADVCLVGLPNAGKSSLLMKLTRANVKTEAYPFTTRSPELGVWKCSDYEQLTLCDLPSLYKASHDGRGMGNQFLKHLELAKGILYVLDPVSDFASSLKEGFEILREEVGHFNKKYLELPFAVIVNKIDLPEAREKASRAKWKSEGPLILTSAVTGEGLEELKKFLQRFLVHAS